MSMVPHFRINSPEPGAIDPELLIKSQIPTPRGRIDSESQDFHMFQQHFHDFQQTQLSVNANIRNLLELGEDGEDGEPACDDDELGGTDDGLSVLSEVAEEPPAITPRETTHGARRFETFKQEFEEFKEQQLAVNENISNLLEDKEYLETAELEVDSVDLGGTEDGLSVLSEEPEAPEPSSMLETTLPQVSKPAPMPERTAPTKFGRSPRTPIKCKSTTPVRVAADVLGNMLQVDEGKVMHKQSLPLGKLKHDPFQAFEQLRKTAHHTDSPASHWDGMSSASDVTIPSTAWHGSNRRSRQRAPDSVPSAISPRNRAASKNSSAGSTRARSIERAERPVEPTGRSLRCSSVIDLGDATEQMIPRRQTWGEPNVEKQNHTADPFKLSQCDTSLLPIAQKPDPDGWKSWTVVADKQGSLFYFNTESQKSVWKAPAELDAVLGRWESTEDSSGTYWHNALLQTSVWRNPYTVTNVFQAAMDNNMVFLQLYSDVSGDLNVADAKRRSPLHYACASGSREACHLLISKSATLDAYDMNRATPLLFASRYGYANICRLLIDARASVNARNSLGETCLHEGAQLGQFDCVILLLLVKADSEAKDNKNLRPVDVARMNQHEETVGILKRDMIMHAAHANFGDEAEESGRSMTESESEESEAECLYAGLPNQTAENIVQKMKPILKGVQGAVNTLFPIKANLGDESRFVFDKELNQWVSR